MRSLIVVIIVAVGLLSACLSRLSVRHSVAGAAAEEPAAEVTIDGTVTDSAGRPVGGAVVALVTDATVPMTLTAGALRKADNDVIPFTATTDAQGRFKLDGIGGPLLRDEAFLIAAAHPEAGYAEVRSEPGGERPAEVRLAPWARFEGTVKLGGVPAAGLRMRLVQSPLTGPQLWVEDEAVADAQGRFVVERCRPGFTIIEQRAGDDGWRRADAAVLRRGDTTRWAGELQRRPVRARLVLPGDATLAVHVQTFLKRVPDQPEPRLPDEAAALFGNERKQWLARWVETTEAGAAYEADRVRFENQSTDVNLRVDREGNMSADDVPTGTYRLYAGAKVVTSKPPAADDADAAAGAAAAPTFYEPPLYDGAPNGPPVDPASTRDASAMLTVRVEPAVGAADAPAVLPDVELVSFTRVEMGQPAPDLVLRRLIAKDDAGGAGPVDGKAGETIRLRDYRGTYLLLDCWATWCGPCLAATPALKALHAAHAPAGRLAVVGVTFDEDADAAARYVRKESLPWEQAIVASEGGDGDNADPVELGGLFGSGLPNFILIDPQGRLASTGHDLTTVRAILEDEEASR